MSFLVIHFLPNLKYEAQGFTLFPGSVASFCLSACPMLLSHDHQMYYRFKVYLRHTPFTLLQTGSVLFGSLGKNFKLFLGTDASLGKLCPNETAKQELFPDSEQSVLKSFSFRLSTLPQSQRFFIFFFF